MYKPRPYHPITKQPKLSCFTDIAFIAVMVIVPALLVIMAMQHN